MFTAQIESSTTSGLPAWQQEGLPGKPVRLIEGGLKLVATDDLLRDDMGKIILARRFDKTATLISEHLGKDIEEINFLSPEGVSLADILDIVGFRHLGAGRLSLMERRAAAALAWLSDGYYQPMKRRDNFVFPTALADLPKDLQSPRLNTLTWIAFTEAKAIQVAAVIEAMWPDISTIVFQEGDGWFVAVESGQREVECVETMERIETIMWLLSDFDVIPNDRGMSTYGSCATGEDWQADQKYLDEQAVRAFDAYTAQERLESKLDAVLTALVGTEGAKAVASKRAAGKAIDVFAEGDKHHLPTKPARKTNKKA